MTKRKPRFAADGYFMMADDWLDALVERGLLEEQYKYNMNYTQDALVQFLNQTLRSDQGRYAASRGIGTDVLN